MLNGDRKLVANAHNNLPGGRRHEVHMSTQIRSRWNAIERLRTTITAVFTIAVCFVNVHRCHIILYQLFISKYKKYAMPSRNKKHLLRPTAATAAAYRPVYTSFIASAYCPCLIHWLLPVLKLVLFLVLALALVLKSKFLVLALVSRH